MDKLIIATNNTGKVKEIKEILAGRFEKIVSLKDEGLIIDVMEDGVTFEENAVKKAKEVANLTGCWALADDSGICVDYLNGAPGVYSARFAGEKATDAANNEKLIELMKDSPESERGAHYACAMALASPEGGVVTAYGEVYGEIIFAPRGENGFGYDPLFYMKEFSKTMAELAPEIKNGISHRFNALKALNEKLQTKKP